MSTLTVIGFALLFVYGIVGYTRPAIGFITAPFVAVGFAYVAMTSDDPTNVILSPVLFVVAMISVVASTYTSESREWYHSAALLLLIWFFLVLVVGILLAGFSEIGAGVILPVLFILGLIAITLSAIGFGLASRRTVAMSVFSTVGASMRQNLPLPMALDCAAVGRYDSTARALRRIKTWMVKGYSLSEAVSRGYPQCSSRALAMLAAGERIGQLPAAVRAVEADLKFRAKERTWLRPVHPAYPVVMLIILSLFTMGLLKFVIPQFKAILEEMNEGKLPTATRLLIRIVQPMMSGDGLLLLLCFGVMGASGLWVYGAWRRRRPEKPYLLSRLGDSLKWHLPMLRWFERNRAMVQVVQVLRMSLDAGCPVNEAIRGTLQLDVNLYFRRHLACWLRRVERGESIGESARQCGLGHALAWAFDGGAETGSTPVVLEMLDAHYRSNYSYRVNLARFILWPVGIIMLGATVGFVVFAVFSALMATLSASISQVYP
jgi:type II secretory pathway component PulF